MTFHCLACCKFGLMGNALSSFLSCFTRLIIWRGSIVPSEPLSSRTKQVPLFLGASMVVSKCIQLWEYFGLGRGAYHVLSTSPHIILSFIALNLLTIVLVVVFIQQQINCHLVDEISTLLDQVSSLDSLF